MLEELTANADGRAAPDAALAAIAVLETGPEALGVRLGHRRKNWMI
jgi:hypothetical protein